MLNINPTIKELFQCINVGVMIVDNDDVIFFVNSRVCQMLGYSEKELVGKVGYEMLFDEAGKKIIQEKNRLRLHGIADSYEIEVRRKNGTTHPIEISGMSITNASNKVVGSIGLFYDIAEKKQFQKSLRLSENYAKQIVDSSLDMIIAVDPHRRIVEFNKAAQSVFGYSQSEILGKHASILYADQNNAEHIQRHLAQFGSWQGEVSNKKKDGTVFISFLTTTMMKDCNGNVIGCMGISRDITDKKRNDEYITTLSSAIHHTADSVIITDTDGTIEYVNPSFEVLSGYSKKEVIGKKPNILKSEKQSRDYYKTMWETLLSGKVFRSELVNKKKNGELFYEEITITPIFDGKKATHFVSTGRNITDRKLVEKRLKEYAHLLDMTMDAIIVTNDAGLITFWNNGAEQMYGFNAEEAIGKKIFELIRVEPEPYAAARQAVFQKGSWSGDLLQTDKFQKQLIVLSRWVVMQDQDNDSFSILVINTNVTERRKMEMDLQRSQRMESLGALAGGLAHDLNNILTPILMTIDLLKRKPSEDLLNSLETYAFRAVDLVKQVLQFARDENKSISFSEIDLKSVIHEVQNVISKTLPPNVRFCTNFDTEFTHVLGNFTQLFQVFMNLCSNAVDAMPSGGVLRISVYNETNEFEDSSTFVTVSDNGIGIPQDSIDKIFDPFFTTKPKSKGTGLGLPTVFSIVKKHNGFISVSSEVGKGSSFQVRFPASQLLVEKYMNQEEVA